MSTGMLGWTFRDAKVDLVFNIAEERLFGSVDGVKIDAHAVAGGRAGSKFAGAQNSFLRNNPMATHVKAPDHPYKGPLAIGKHGGPLPIGKYTLGLSPKPNHPGWVKLNPENKAILRNRTDNFYIHPTGGPAGSEGCIGLNDRHVISTLLRLVKQRIDHKKAPPLLQVLAIGSDLDAKNRSA